MADEGDKTNKATADNITEVPTHLQEFVRSRVIRYISRTKSFSTVIEQTVGQDTAKLVIHCGETTRERKFTRDEHEKAKDQELNAKTTNTILVGNIPPTANEEILEVFFESRKKGGGSPVKNIRLNRNKHWATIVFDEPGAVENVIRKKPILLMNAELDIHPYIPIIQGDGWIGNLELHGLPKELTEDLMAKDIERKVGSAEASSAEYLSEDDEEENDGENVEETGNIVAQIKDVTPVKVRMFMATNDDEEVFEKFPNVKMKMNKKTNVINFYGNAAEIQPFKLDVYKKLSTFSVYTFPDISQSSIKLFKSSKVAENINNKLSSNKLECEWETEGTSLIICSCEREIDECCRMVRNSVKEVRFPVCKEAAAVFLSSQWQEDQHALSKKVDFICNMKTMEDTIEVHIVAEHDTIDAVVREIKAFVQQETKRNTEAIKFNKLGPVHETLFDMGLASKLVQKIINDLSMYHVSIERILDDDFYISGTMEGRELVKKRIQNINL